MLYDFFQNYSGVVIALSSGFFGATFFMLVQLSDRLSGGSGEDAREMWNWNFLVLRSLVGIGGALIIYFFSKVDCWKVVSGRISPCLTMKNWRNVARTAHNGAYQTKISLFS
jgi:hypothetical protein